MRTLYTLLLYLALPIVLCRWLWRSIKMPRYRERLAERFGFMTPLSTERPVIWIHAVSVGEMIAATPLVKTLLKIYPQYQYLVTNTTPTGSEQARKTFGDSVSYSYLPYDIPNAINRFLKRAHPYLFILLETELWPNLLHCTHRKNIPIILVNARLSEKSLCGYQRIRKLTKKMLNHLTAVAAQTVKDQERFLLLGLQPDKIHVTGNIKFDLQLPPLLTQNAATLKESWHNRPTWIAASTHDGEEKIILTAYKEIIKKYPDILLILVPRHSDRFRKVASLCEGEGYTLAKRSLMQNPDINTSILLVDTIGELLLFYAASDIAFVGGSLITTVGGHNLIEPAANQLPLISGPHLYNFAEVSRLLRDADALRIVNDANELADEVNALLADPSLRKTLGARAYAVSIANKGALQKQLDMIALHLMGG